MRRAFGWGVLDFVYGGSDLVRILERKPTEWTFKLEKYLAAA